FYSPFGLNLHLLERGLRFYLKIFLRKTQGVVVPSRAILDEIMALSPRANIADVIPTGVDPERFRPDISGQGIRTKWGLNGHDVVLHVGRVAPEKNLTTLIHAFPRILEQNRDTKLMIVGTGPYMEKYYDLVARLGLSGDVIFTGFVPDADLPKYYAAADAFAIASKFETQGRVSGMDGPSEARGRPGPPEGAPVSIIVPTWNEAKCLPALLDSLRAQSRSPAEILVADSGSTDGTQELAQATGAIVLEGERKGPGEGRNRGARAARGDL